MTSFQSQLCREPDECRCCVELVDAPVSVALWARLTKQPNPPAARTGIHSPGPGLSSSMAKGSGGAK